MTNQVIPEIAVEAAMTAAVEYLTEWSPNLSAGLDGFNQVFKVSLEAAVPHMASAEYDRGFDEGHRAGQESMETE